MEDSPKLSGMRKALVDDLDAKIGLNFRIKKAFMDVPRHYFLDSALAENAYKNNAISIDENQTISTPSTVALQTKWLDVQFGDKILELGTGSGFQASILAAMGADVHSIERHPDLSKKAESVIRFLELPIHLYIGDGTLGLPHLAPFDKIIVTAAAPEIPKTLILQLKIGGIMVIPIGELDKQTMHKITKTETELLVEKQEGFKFVPLIGQFGW